MSSTPNVIWDDQPKAPPVSATAPEVQWDDEAPKPPAEPTQPVKPAPVQITQPSPAIPPAIAEQVRTALPNIAQYPENQQKPDPDYVQRKAAFEAVQGEPGAPQDFEYDAEQERRIKAQEQVASGTSMVPQAAVPALAAAKKYAVDPFERASQAGAQVGRDLAARALVTPPVEIPMQDNLPPVTEQEVQERLKDVPAPVVGTARAAGSVVGGVVADPRMWPLFFMGPEASAAKTAMSAGFATQMAVGAYEQAGELGKIMDNPDVPQEDKWEAGANMVLSTLMAAQAGGHPAIEAVKARLKEFQNLPPADQEQIRNILRKKAPEIATEVDKSAGTQPTEQAAPKVTWDDQAEQKTATKPERFRLPRGTSAAEVQGEVKGPNIRTVQVGDKTYAFDQRKINADGVKSAVERNELWRLTGGKAPEAAKAQAEQDVRGEESQPATEQPVKEQAAPEVKWDDEAEKPKPQAAAPQTKVQVPVMITRQMESDLRARGVSQQDIDRMTPEQAHTKLQEQKVSESPQTAESATKPIEEKVSSKPEVSEESAQPERRTDTATRKRVADMSPEERSHELLTSELTKLPNRRAFEEDSHTLAESHPHVGYADLDDFKRYNDALGHEGVDKAVLPAIGDLFRDAAAKEPSDSVKVYHRSGDEFNFRSTTPEAIKRVTDRVNKELTETTFRYQTKDGRILEKKGTGLSHGIGTDHESAEENSHADKQRRKELGLREGGRDLPAVDTRGAAGEQTAVRENTERERVLSKPAEEVEPSQTISGHLNGRRSSKIGTLTLPDKTVLELSVRPDPSQMGVYSLSASNGKNSTSYRMQYKGRDTLADVKKSFEEYLNIDSPGHEVTIGAPKQPHELTLPEFAKNQGKPAENRYVQQQHEAVKKKAAASRAKLSADKLSDFQVGRDKVVREGDRTYVVDRSGSHARTEVLSDAITPEFKANAEKLTPEQRQRMIETVKTTPYLSDEGRKERLEVLQGQGEVKPAEAARADTSAEKKRIHDEIQALNKERNSLGFKIDADRFNPSPETKTLVERHTELGRKMRALDDEVAKLDGWPTSSEKREIAKNEAEKKFAERPTGSMKYGDAAQSQPWQVSEKDFIARRFESEAKRYEKAVAEQEKKVADLRPGSTKRISEESSLHFWNERLAKLKAGDDPRITQEFRNAYIKHVKEAISHGRPVPQEVIDQHPEFVKAQDARERYEKGKHTSFSNRSVAINDTMQKELGFKVKRQDGKPITDEQIKEIHQSVKDVESIIGPMADIMRGVDLTVVHTNGKFPFLMNDAAGLFSEADRRITVGLQSMFSPRSIPVLAHEIGHMIDIKGGNLLGESARLYTKGGKGYTTTALSEADAKKFKGDLISQATEAINNVRKVRELLRAKKTEDLTPEEKQEIEGAKVKLGPYWREPREVFARLFEQYIANELGKRSEAAQSPESYAEQPGYWKQQQFEKFIPKIEAEINRRLDALHAKYGVPGSEAPKAGKTEAATAGEPVPKAKQEAPAIAQFDEAVKQTGAEVKEGKPSPEFAAKIADATHLEPANHAALKEKFTGAAYQREYFKAALEQAKEAWIAGKESKVPGEGGEVWEFLAKDSSYAKETDRPADYESDQLYVKVPEDGHFLVNNTPFAIEKALKGATRGFAAPRASFNPEAKVKKFSAPKATPEAIEKYRKELAEELSAAEGDKSYAESRLKDDKESREKHAQLTDDLNKELKALRAKSNGEQEKVVRQEYQDKIRRLPRQMSDDDIESAHDTIAQRDADIPVLHQNVKDFEEQFPSNDRNGERGSATPSAMPIPALISSAAGVIKKGRNLYHGAVDKALDWAHMGQTRPEIRKFDPDAADLATKMDAGGQYHKAFAEMIGKKVTGPLAETFDKTDNYASRQKKNEISRDRMKGFHFLADAQNREWLEENHPEDFHRWNADPKIKEALDAYKPFESQLRDAVKQLGGKTIDEDYIKRVMDFATSGVAYEKGLAHGVEGPVELRQGAAAGAGGGRDSVVSPQIDRSKARKDAGKFYWDHGVFDFGPSFEKRWVEVQSKLDEHRLAVHSMSMGTRVMPDEAMPEKVFYNGQEFYRPDIAKEIREVQKRGVSAESKALADALGVSELPTPKDVREYANYEPLRRGSRFETAARNLAANVLAGKEGLEGQAANVNRMAKLRYALPKEIVDALNDAGREKELGAASKLAQKVLGPLTQFIRQQIVGLAYGVPHMANILRKVVQATPGAALNPVAWANAFKVAFSKELKARGISGTEDPTYNMLLRNAAVSEGAVPEYKRYIEGNMDAENWAQTVGNAFRKGGKEGAKVTPLSAAAGLGRLAIEPLNRFSEVGHRNLFKPGGIDQRARLWLGDFLKDRYPGMNEQRIAHEVNQTLGRYNRASWTDVQRNLGPLMLFPGWDYSSMAFALKHPFKTAVAPAVLMLLANAAVHSIGGNKSDEKNDLERVHIGKYSVRTNLFNDNMGSHMWGWALRGAKAGLDHKNAKEATGEVVKGMPGDVAGVTTGTMNPILSTPIQVGENRLRPGGGAEIAPRGDFKKKGHILPNKAAEDYADFGARRLFPIYDRATQAGQRPSVASFAGLAGVSVNEKKNKK